MTSYMNASIVNDTVDNNQVTIVDGDKVNIVVDRVIIADDDHVIIVDGDKVTIVNGKQVEPWMESFYLSLEILDDLNTGDYNYHHWQYYNSSMNKPTRANTVDNCVNFSFPRCYIGSGPDIFKLPVCAVMLSISYPISFPFMISLSYCS